MIGNNELQLNEATMIEAVQMWVDANFTNPPKVKSIDVDKDGAYKTFTVNVDGGEKKEQG